MSELNYKYKRCVTETIELDGKPSIVECEVIV